MLENSVYCMSSYAEDDLRKNLKFLYDNLPDAEKNEKTIPLVSKINYKWFMGNLQYQEERIGIVFGLGDFGLGDFEPEYLCLDHLPGRWSWSQK